MSKKTLFLAEISYISTGIGSIETYTSYDYEQLIDFCASRIRERKVSANVKVLETFDANSVNKVELIGIMRFNEKGENK